MLNDVESQNEVGYWGVSGPIDFSIMTGWIKNGEYIPSDPEKAYFYDAYQIVELNDESFTYRSFDQQVEFKVRKVDDDFVWPGGT